MTTWLVACVLLGQAIPSGSARIELDLGTDKVEAYTYRPANYRSGPMLLVFHGVLRNAEEYRDHARGMGDQLGMLVVAPRFADARYAPGMYQQGGLVRDGKLAPRDKWTWSLVPRLADRLRRLEGRPEMPYYLIGHSGGGQFLIRMAAFVPTEAARVVVANPGSDLFPTRELRFPYGFGGLPNPYGDDDQIRRYLAQPLTLYLGSGDTVRDEDLDKSEAADRQGRTRYERGKAAYRLAEDLAKHRGWEFRWRLVEAPGVAHDHQRMFDAPACREALMPAN